MTSRESLIFNFVNELRNSRLGLVLKLIKVSFKNDPTRNLCYSSKRNYSCLKNVIISFHSRLARPQLAWILEYLLFSLYNFFFISIHLSLSLPLSFSLSLLNGTKKTVSLSRRLDSFYFYFPFYPWGFVLLSSCLLKGGWRGLYGCASGEGAGHVKTIWSTIAGSRGTYHITTPPLSPSYTPPSTTINTILLRIIPSLPPRLTSSLIALLLLI